MTELIFTAGDDAAAIAGRVRSAFERVWHERMAGLPFVNDKLRVELVGLRRWHGLWLGVLVTPWFMNLLLLPGTGAATGDDAPAARWPGAATGTTASFAFPAGRLEFIAGREGGAGEYLACSLFSPMFDFADHEAACQTAKACLVALFDAGNAAQAEQPAATTTVSKRDFLHGRWCADDATATKGAP